MSRVGLRCKRKDVLGGEAWSEVLEDGTLDHPVYTLAEGENFKDHFDKPRKVAPDWDHWMYDHHHNATRADESYINKNVVIIAVPWKAKPTFGPGTDFPHRCTRCGEWAYVGAYEVTHHDEENSSCSARRPTTLRKQA